MPRQPMKSPAHGPAISLARGSTLAAVGLLFAACGGNATESGSGFQLTKISVQNGQVWQINRAIRMEFNDDVNFNTVNGNSISIAQAPASGQILPTVPGGVGALGTFVQIDAKTVEFRPTCPTADDYSDAGLEAGQIVYNLAVLGKDSGIAVTSMAGAPLQNSQVRTFSTPGTTTPFIPSEIFQDTVPGAPLPAKDAAGQNTTYLELGGDPMNRIYFTDANTGPDGVLMGEQEINLFSDPTTRVAVMLQLNQSVDPASTNIASDRVRLEFRPVTVPETVLWTNMPTTVALIKNCSDTGSTLRLVPGGILPQRSEVRVVITSEFSDLVGEKNALPLTDDFIFRTREYDFPSLTPSPDMADEHQESFVASGNSPVSFEDTSPVFAVPTATWGSGRLQANFDFSGTGGPGGDFDYLIPSGVTIALDTSLFVIVGGPGFIPSKTQTVVGGVLNVRNLMIEPGGKLVAAGSNPLIIQATGWVRVEGDIEVDGIPAADIATLNTGNIPEPGGPGIAGGGAGGSTSWLTTTSTPKGENGFGAFNVTNLGGRGGESGYGTGAKNNRRPGGGGGGTFGGPMVSGFTFGKVSEKGEDGNPNATGAISGGQPPRGGTTGPPPFVDGDPDNDFWGKQVDATTSTVIQGELPTPWAGAGGGGGGDAVNSATFPHPDWTVSTDEKGGPGGGGAGQLQILALGDIFIEGTGQLLASGGGGATGENTIGTDHLGGGGGGGSGGHVILQTPKKIFLDNHIALYTPVNPNNNNLRAIVARGGRGAKGASGFDSENAGGDGGPGVLQMHVLNLTDIVFDPAVITDVSKVSEPPPVVLVPSYGPVSRAQSKWIPLGGATFDPGPIGGSPGTTIVNFSFDGTDGDDLSPDAGRVDTSGGLVADLPPLLTSGTDPLIAAVGKTLEIDASSLANTANDIYLRNPALMREFRVELNGGLQVTQVVSATTDPADVTRLFLTVQDTLPGVVGAYAIVPRFFRVVTGTAFDSLPANTYVKIEFQGAPEDASGNPDTTTLNPWTADIQKLNVPAGAPLQFYRFRVEFNIDVNGTSLDGNTPRPALDFLRTPFRF